MVFPPVKIPIILMICADRTIPQSDHPSPIPTGAPT